MTPFDFKAALALTGLSIDGKATFGALLVLVDGARIAHASREAQCTTQAVRHAIGVIRKATKRCPYCGSRLEK